MFASNEITQTTEALERLPRVLERQSAHTGKRLRTTEEKNTDTLPPLTLEAPNAKVLGRQVTQLRKDNKHLRVALEGQRAEMQRILSDHTQLRSELATAQQDLAHYQTQLQDSTEELNRLIEAKQALEGHYQALQDTVQEEAHKLMQEATEAAIQSPESVSPLMQDVVRTVTLHVKQEEDKHLIEALYLKREVQRMSEFLEQERQQLQKEQQQLISFQLSVREQANTRRKLLEERLHARERVFSLVTSVALLALFIILEFVCLALFQTPAIGSVALSIILPIVVCILLRIVLATPLGLLKTIYTSAPHKRRVKAQA